MRIHIVLDLSAAESLVRDSTPPQVAIGVGELLQNVAENGGTVVIPGTVFQTLAIQGKEERARLLELITNSESVVIVPPVHVTETLEIAEVVARHAISPDLAHALILSRDTGAGLAVLDGRMARMTGIVPAEDIFEI